MKTLHFTHAGTDYACSLESETLGHVTQKGDMHFNLPHPEWKIAGFAKSHYRISPETPIHPSMTAEQVEGGMVFDVDHNTRRKWMAQSGGRTARARYVYTRDSEAVKKFALERRVAAESFDNEFLTGGKQS